MGTAGALAIVIGAAIVTALIALPLALRKVPRNRLYGVRTRRTLADDRVWYETNAYGGRCLIVASGVGLLAVGLLYALAPLPDDLLVLAGVAALVVPSLVATVLAVRYAGRISRQED